MKLVRYEKRYQKIFFVSALIFLALIFALFIFNYLTAPVLLSPTECNDTRDNDEDGFIDLSDPQCNNDPNDNCEATAPGEITIFNFFDVSPGTITLYWNNTDGINYGATVSIEKSTDGINFAERIRWSWNNHYFTDREVLQGTTYYYRAKAISCEGETSYTEIINATTGYYQTCEERGGDLCELSQFCSFSSFPDSYREQESGQVCCQQQCESRLGSINFHFPMNDFYFYAPSQRNQTSNFRPRGSAVSAFCNSNCPTFLVNGGYDGQGAMDFDGANRLQSLTNEGTTDYGSLTRGTISTWINLSAGNRQQTIISRKADASSSNPNFHYALQINPSNQIVCIIGNKTFQNTATSSSVIALNRYYHVACTFDDTTMKIYIDAQEDATVQKNVVPTGESVIYFGINPANALENLSGRLDEVRVHTTPLSQEEIELLYQGISGWWTFDDEHNVQSRQIQDNSGNGITLVDGLAGPLYVAGRDGSGAFYFSRSLSNSIYSQLEQYNNLSYLNFGTVSAWVNITEANVTKGIIFKGQEGITYIFDGANYVFQINAENKLQCGVANGTAFENVVSASSLNENQYYHVACTWSNAELRVYINGQLDGQNAKTLLPLNAHSPPRIGINNDSAVGGNFFTGEIDDVRIYSLPLSENEIMQLSSSICGNGLIDVGESCDTDNLNGQTCQSRGYDSGSLACNSNCQFDTSQCTTTPPPDNNPGGGGGGGSSRPACVPQWSCNVWSECSNSIQSRTCQDTRCRQQNRTEQQQCGEFEQIADDENVEQEEERATLPGNVRANTKKFVTYALLAASVVVALVAISAGAVYYMKRKGYKTKAKQYLLRQMALGHTPKEAAEVLKQYKFPEKIVKEAIDEAKNNSEKNQQ